MLAEIGFEAISIERKAQSDEIIRSWNFGPGTEKLVFSGYIRARKPLN